MTRTLLVDADLLSYRSSAATQKAYKWDGVTASVAADFEAAKRYAEDELSRLIDRLQPDDLIVCLSDDITSFRKERIDRTYKSARNAVERPVYLYDLKDWLRSEYIVEERPTLEADDVMGILATDPSRTDERIIVSSDKDMMTIPGALYRPHLQVDAQGRFLKQPRVLDISELEAIRFHFWQTIVGDTTDGYPGAPRVGKLSPFAQDVLEAETEEDAWEEVLMAFASVGLDEDAAVRQARLARILHFQDYDGQHPIMWLPPAYEPEWGD
jgi:DNA polymerase-1